MQKVKMKRTIDDIHDDVKGMLYDVLSDLNIIEYVIDSTKDYTSREKAIFNAILACYEFDLKTDGYRLIKTLRTLKNETIDNK